VSPGVCSRTLDSVGTPRSEALVSGATDRLAPIGLQDHANEKQWWCQG
jgi:hypothetical protein